MALAAASAGAQTHDGATPPSAAKSITLYTNFNAIPAYRYDGATGWPISSDANGAPVQMAAMPFSPTVDATVGKIKLALTWVSGTNGAKVALHADSGGLPGVELGLYKVSKLPPFGSCCDTRAVNQVGVPVSAGAQYWVVVSTKKSATTSALWNRNSTGVNGAVALHDGWGWFAVPDLPGAFSVHSE